MKSTKIIRGVLSVAALGLAAVFISSPAIAATPDAVPLQVVHVTTPDGAIAPASVSGCISKTVPGDAFHRATSSYSFTIGKKTEDAQGAAWARYTQGFTATTGDATKWVGIWVGGDT